jgi:hypothetical protein
MCRVIEICKYSVHLWTFGVERTECACRAGEAEVKVGVPGFNCAPEGDTQRELRVFILPD